MDDTDFTVSLERAAELEAARIQRLQSEIWDSLLEFFGRYVGDERDVWQYLHEVTRSGREQGWFHGDPQGLHFEFPEHDGARKRSASLARHWTRLGFAARRKTLDSIAEHVGVHIEQENRSLESLLFEPEALFVSVEGRLWRLEPGVDGRAELVGDGETREVDGLLDEQRRVVEQVRERALCACGMCARLRPDARFEELWRHEMAHAGPTNAEDASRYLLQTVAPSDDAILDLARFAPHTSMYRYARRMFEFGRRLGVQRLSFVRGAIEHADDARVQAALVAVVAGLPLDADTRTNVLCEFFDLASPAAETAVEFLGYGDVPPRRFDDLAEILSDRVDRSHDLDHAIAVTLYNLYRDSDRLPRRARQAFERLAASSGEASDVATRALTWFDGR